MRVSVVNWNSGGNKRATEMMAPSSWETGIDSGTQRETVVSFLHLTEMLRQEKEDYVLGGKRLVCRK